MSRSNQLFLISVVILAVVFAGGCWGREEEIPESGDLEFYVPEDIPEAVGGWLEDMERSRARDWMIVDDVLYIAVARGETPNPGYGVDVDGVSFVRDGSTYDLTISASYTSPDSGEDHPQVPAYPVALVAVTMDQLRGAGPADIALQFDVDESSPEVADDEDGHHTVTLYFGTEDGQMTRVYRTLRVAELDADLIVAELMADPIEPGTVRVIPEGTRLTAVTDTDDPSLVNVDFSEEILRAQGTLGEMLAVYSVVNSLLDNDLGYDRVMVSVDGESRELGHLDISEPLEFDEVFVIGDK